MHLIAYGMSWANLKQTLLGEWNNMGSDVRKQLVSLIKTALDAKGVPIQF